MGGFFFLIFMAELRLLITCYKDVLLKKWRFVINANTTSRDFLFGVCGRFECKKIQFYFISNLNLYS